MFKRAIILTIILTVTIIQSGLFHYRIRAETETKLCTCGCALIGDSDSKGKSN